MLDYLSQVYVLLASKLFLAVYVQGCAEGWFGAYCKYMCHCQQSKSCDVKGQCPNSDRCKVGFFGPGCQYVDLLSSDASATVEAYLQDNNDGTCNPDPNATSVEVSWNKSYPFTWYRIHANNSDNLLSFTTELNNGTACINERKFLVSDTVVDVTCDRKISVNKLRITGAIAASVCSVYISGGRNLALKQKTQQSSNCNDNEQIGLCQSSNAVDGNTDGDFSKGHCSSTGRETGLPNWGIKYNRTVILYKVRVYNRNEYQGRLKLFAIETLDSISEVATDKNDSSDAPWAVKDIDMDSQTLVTNLKIEQGRTQSPEDQILTLCEVETYGDIVCPNNTYGLNCEARCNCSKSETCSPVTGACSSRCPPGFYGQNCVARCSINCLHKICKYSSGDCLKCTPGFSGTTCMDACLPGTFGSDCLLHCSEHCTTPCYHINGNCSCQPGFSGFFCTECTEGLFGDNCTTACPCKVCDRRSGDCTLCVGNRAGRHCEECTEGFIGANCTMTCPSVCKECDKQSGDCISCVGHRAGRHCEACRPKYYGKNCDQACSVRCLKRTCHHSTGSCFECEYGYHGDKCEQEYSPTWMLFLLVMSLTLLFCMFYKKGHKSATEEVT